MSQACLIACLIALFYYSTCDASQAQHGLDLMSRISFGHESSRPESIFSLASAIFVTIDKNSSWTPPLFWSIRRSFDKIDLASSSSCVFVYIWLSFLWFNFRKPRIGAQGQLRPIKNIPYASEYQPDFLVVHFYEVYRQVQWKFFWIFLRLSYFPMAVHWFLLWFSFIGYHFYHITWFILMAWFYPSMGQLKLGENVNIFLWQMILNLWVEITKWNN